MFVLKTNNALAIVSSSRFRPRNTAAAGYFYPSIFLGREVFRVLPYRDGLELREGLTAIRHTALRSPRKRACSTIRASVFVAEKVAAPARTSRRTTAARSFLAHRCPAVHCCLAAGCRRRTPKSATRRRSDRNACRSPIKASNREPPFRSFSDISHPLAGRLLVAS